MFKLIIDITYEVICISLFKMELVSTFGHYLVKLNLPLLTMFKIHKINNIKSMVKEIRITINYF